jgi:glycosyltransferase involved in cell wall biosynthesis
MRITIVQGGFLPVPPVLGGAVEKVWFKLGSEFARLGHQVTHISRLYSELPPEEIINGVRHVRIKGFDAPRSRVFLWLKDLAYACRALRVLPPADILVTNSLSLPVLVRGKGHGSLYIQIGRYPKGQTRFYHHAVRLQAVSSVVAKAIIRQDPKGARLVKVIPYPLPNYLENIDVAGSWHLRKKVILYVGRIHPEKGIDLLIEAFRLLVEAGFQDWHLALVGPWESAHGGGGAQYYKKLRSAGSSVAENIDWIGPIFDAGRLADQYRRAKLFVYPSVAVHGEALPVAPLEAMAFGCPPLVSALDCFRDYVVQDESGFIQNEKADSPVCGLFHTLKAAIEDELKLVSVAAGAYQVAQRYDPVAVAELYVGDFRALLSTKTD